MPTTPPAGPDRIASLPRKARAPASPPFDCMNSNGAATAAATWSTWARSTGDRYASTTVVSPRGISLISAPTSWLTEIWVKPMVRASAASRASCAVKR